MARTAAKTTAPAVKRENKRYLRGIILIAVVFCCFGLLALGCWQFKKLLFEHNDHFLLRRVVIDSPGWWGKTEDSRNRLLSKLQLNVKEDNLFSYQLPKLRQLLCSIPSIESAQVERILPDTLKLTISERIPRAFLGNSQSILVLDFSGMVMSKDECVEINPRMPVIFGHPTEGVTPGTRLPQLQPVLEVISEALMNFGDFRIVAIRISQTDAIQLKLFYKDSRLYNGLMPPGNANYYLNMLQSAIEEALRTNNRKPNANLTYDGGVVFTDDPIGI